MSKQKQPADEGRRQFLCGSAVAGAGAVIAAGIPATAVAETAVQEADAKPAEEGYRLTQHVLDYYKSAAS